MNRLLIAAIAASTLFVACGERSTPAARPTDWVTTLVGTQSDFSFSNGNTYPAVALPWGMNFWTPQTGKMGDGWIYDYNAKTICGFRQTHQPSPWINDYGQFALMPVADRSKCGETERASIFSHKSEIAKPYYYSVYLADHDIKAEMAPTERAAIMDFTFPESATSGVVIDAFDRGSYIKVIPEEQCVVGYTTRNSGGVPDNFRNWFVVRFDTQFDDIKICGAAQDSILEFEGDHAMAVVGFKTQRGQSVTARVASSFISLEQAYENLRELGDDTLAQTADKAQKRWDDVLGRIEVSGGDDEQMRTFYSCLYRSVLFPRKFYEVAANGDIIHYSPYNGEIAKGYMYTDTGFWDTFRALMPLVNLVYPSVGSEIQQGLANAARESGFLPEWASPGHRGCMVGNNSASVVADAVVKGANDKDLQTLYDAMVNATKSVHPTVSSTGRLGYEYYNELGYIPYDVNINENVARTLEYAYDDWCILQLARKLNRPESEQKLWAERSQNYRNVFDTQSRLMRGRNRNGEFQSPFSPYKWGDAFTEGNAWHYTWSVFHDVEGLVQLMGGDAEFSRMLDSVFVVPPVADHSYYGFRIHEIAEMQVAEMGNYAHGNQPAQHMIYLYDYVGEPWKTQFWAREVMNRLYTSAPDGYCGDEDNGQTSAWYVFSAMGFYPVCPASDEYAVGAPLFRNVKLHLENGNTIEINAPKNGAEARYVDKMRIDGKASTANYLRHSELLRGASVGFDMSSEPNKERGVTKNDAPYSFSRE